jgi:hypothetical protein
MNSLTPMTVHESGMKVATSLPQLTKIPPPQSIQGGLIQAAAAKTANSIAVQAGHAKAAGVTMKGGGTPITVPQVTEGKTIGGVSFAANHANLIGVANQLKADAVYDGLAGTQPYQLGGRRKHSRKTKKHGRRNRRRSRVRHSRKHHGRRRRTIRMVRSH